MPPDSFPHERSDSRRLSRPVAGNQTILDEKISGSTAKVGRRDLSEEDEGIVHRPQNLA